MTTETTTRDPLADAVLAAQQAGTLSAEELSAYLRKPQAWKLCSGAPSLGVEPHPQLRERFASDATADGLYRMCKPCDSVTQRAYRIRLKLRAQGLEADPRTVRAILEAPVLMPGKVARAVAAVEPAPAPEPVRVPQEGDPALVLGVRYTLARVGVQADVVELRTRAGGVRRTASATKRDLSWDEAQGAWVVENASVALAVAQVAPPAAEPRPAPKPGKSTPEQRARWAAAKRAQRAAAK